MKKMLLVVAAVCLLALTTAAQAAKKPAYDAKYVYTFDSSREETGWKCVGIFNASNDAPLDTGSFEKLPYWSSSVNATAQSDPAGVANKEGSLLMPINGRLFPTTTTATLSKWKYVIRSPRLDMSRNSPWKKMTGYELYFVSNVPGITIEPALVAVDSHNRELVLRPIEIPDQPSAYVIDGEKVGNWQKISYTIPAFGTDDVKEIRYIQIDVIGDINIIRPYSGGDIANNIDLIYPLLNDE